MAAPRDGPSLGYSNLEVAPSSQSDLKHSAGMEVVQGDYHYAYRGGHGHDAKQSFKTTLNPSSSLAPEVVEGQHAPEVVGKDGILLRPKPPTICGIRRKVFWIVMGVTVFVTIVAAVGAGVGGYLASRPEQLPENSTGSSDRADSLNPTNARFQNLSIAALHWVERNGVSQYRLYYSPPASQGEAHVLESAWSSDTRTWKVSPITDAGVDPIKPGTPIAASAGFYRTDTNNELVCTLVRSLLVLGHR